MRFRKQKLKPDDVIWCYRTILGREPENDAVIAGHVKKHKSLKSLVQTVLSSDEYGLNRKSLNARSSNLPQMDLDGRVAMTTGCIDCAEIPKVPGAGSSYLKDGIKVQLMHEGTEVVCGGYCGDWMSELIRRLDGHHEPQEELIFHHLIKHSRPNTRIFELGANWAYYSNWYLGAVDGAQAVCLEPDANSMRVGQENLKINDREARWLHACVGATHSSSIEMKNESDGALVRIQCHHMDSLLEEVGSAPIEILHMDIQGAELGFLVSCARAVSEGLLRFMIVSTHHESISGSKTTHRDCINQITSLGGYVLCEHSVEESYSGDGLIVASFRAEDQQIELPGMSRNSPRKSLFGPSTDALDSVELVHARTGPMLVLGEDTSIGQMIRTEGGFEQGIISDVTDFLRDKYDFKPEQFFDIGANIGTHLIYALQMEGFESAVAVEMEENNFSLLQCNIILNGLFRRTKLYHTALSDEVGESLIELAEGNLGDHRVRVRSNQAQPVCGEDSRRTKAVSKVTLEHLIQEQAISVHRNTLVWVDTQGHEGQVLRGGAGIWASEDKPYLVLEFWPYAVEIAGGRESLFESLSLYDAFFDINAPDWQNTPLVLNDVVDLYEKLCPGAGGTGQPFTDILCVPNIAR